MSRILDQADFVKKVSEVDQNSGEMFGKSEFFSLDMSTVEQNDNFEQWAKITISSLVRNELFQKLDAHPLKKACESPKF